MTVGIDIMDFGVTPTDTATKLVTGLSGLTVNSRLEAFAQGSDSTGDNDVDAHDFLAFSGRFSCSYVSATEMRVTCNLLLGLASQTFMFGYATG